MQRNGARRRALLAGGGWTAAAVAALAWFKSAPAEPITLWTMGVVALGWAGILLYALAAERRAAGITIAAAGCDSRGVIDGLAQAMGAEMQRACRELVQVDELLAHAIERLMAAFDSVSEQGHRHQSELALAAAGAQRTPEAERWRAAAEHAASNISKAVTALQFRDVVGQKLGYVRRELEALEQLMQRVRELSAAQAEAAMVGGRARAQAQFAARVKALLLELEQVKAANPAQQALMHAGEVDLF